FLLRVVFQPWRSGERGMRCGCKPRPCSVGREFFLVMTRQTRCVVTTPGRCLTPGGSGRLRDLRLACFVRWDSIGASREPDVPSVLSVLKPWGQPRGFLYFRAPQSSGTGGPN